MLRHLFTFLLIVSIQDLHARSYLPPTWMPACNVTITPPEPATMTRPYEGPAVVVASCAITAKDDFAWRLNDLRNWTSQEKINFNTTTDRREAVYKLRVTCQAGANISLAWPMKIIGLQELNVSSCILVDRYANYKNPADLNVPDEMRILDIRDSQWLVGRTNDILSESQTSVNISSEYDCGNDDTLEVFITRNVSDVLDMESALDVASGALALNRTSIPSKPKEQLSAQLPGELSDEIGMSGTVKPETRLIKDAEKVVSDQINTNLDAAKSKQPAAHSKQLLIPGVPESNSSQVRMAEEEYLELLRKVFETRTRCNYVKLKVLDHSVAQLTPVFMFEFLVKGALYPVLEHMNFSTIGITQFPRELSEWRRFFPKLTYIDLSNNSIAQVQFKDFPSKKDTGVVTFNLQHNNITTINMDILNSWADIEKMVVDIRENPIHCGCELEYFIPHLHNEKTFTGNLAAYKYVADLKCATPASLQGRTLFSLALSALPCPVYESHQAALIALGVILSFFLVVVIILVRYKVEIRILLYTRLHVRLPCDVDELRHSKTYDAFISYSNDDDAWVFENLVKFLEGSPVPSKQHESNGVVATTQGGRNADLKRAKTFRLCIHQRDFVPGKTIFDNIVDSIEASRHTIIVLSPSFMNSHWAMEELRQAYRQSLVEKTRHLVVLLLHKVPKEEMDPLIARCCKTFTYLDVNDSLFKDRLIFSLTTKDRSARRRDRLLSKKTSTQKPPSRREPPSIGHIESGAHDNAAYISEAPRPNELPRGSSIRSAAASSTQQNGTKDNPALKSSKHAEPLSPSHLESGVYDSITYFPPVGRPPEPLRVMSNMSTSSTTSLIQ